MSEVYIRSQNKEKLYRLGGNYACVEYGEYEDIKKKRGGAEADKKRHVICISDGCLEEIGEYATKERCLEVLGRYQSRQYEKVLDAATGEREQRTAYEVSVRLIRRKEEAENEC